MAYPRRLDLVPGPAPVVGQAPRDLDEVVREAHRVRAPQRRRRLAVVGRGPVVGREDERPARRQQTVDLVDDPPALRVVEHVDHAEAGHDGVVGAVGQPAEVAHVEPLVARARGRSARPASSIVVDVGRVDVALELDQVARQAPRPAAELEHPALEVVALAHEEHHLAGAQLPVGVGADEVVALPQGVVDRSLEPVVCSGILGHAHLEGARYSGGDLSCWISTTGRGFTSIGSLFHMPHAPREARRHDTSTNHPHRREHRHRDAHAGHRRGQHGHALDRPRSRCAARRPPVDRRRLHPGPGHGRAHRGIDRRPHRPAPGLPRRPRGLHRRLGGLCRRADRARPRRRPRDPGARRRDALRGLAAPAHARLPRRARARRRLRRLRRDDRELVRARPAGRRRADLRDLLGVGVPRQRPARDRRLRGDPPRRRRVVRPAPASRSTWPARRP